MSTTDTTNLPLVVEELTISPVFNTFKRDIKSELTLRDAAPHPNRPEGGTIVLNLTVTHNKDSKAFNAYLNISENEPRGGYFAVSHWEPMNTDHNLRLPSIPCARYSEKALRTAWHQVVATLKADPSILARLNLSTDGVSR